MTDRIPTRKADEIPDAEPDADLLDAPPPGGDMFPGSDQQQQAPPTGDRVVKRGPVGVRTGIAPSPPRPGGDDSS